MNGLDWVSNKMFSRHEVTGRQYWWTVIFLKLFNFLKLSPSHLYCHFHWLPHCVSLANMIVGWQYYMTSSTGWMSMGGLSTILVWWCTGVCMTGRLGISLITSFQPLMLLLAVFIRSANLNRLTVPRCRLSTYGCRCRAFYHASSTVWNSLPDERRNSDSSLNDSWKQFFFSRY